MSNHWVMQRVFGGVLVSWLLFAASPLSAQELASGGPAIGGYSPVSYFTEGKAEAGSPEFAVQHGDTVYYLTSAEQVTLFQENPDKFRPRHKFCPYSLSQGMKKALDPTNFKVIGNSLLLFHKSEEVDGLALWNASPLSDQELLERADKQFVLLQF